jgi:hypothetical protein
MCAFEQIKYVLEQIMNLAFGQMMKLAFGQMIKFTFGQIKRVFGQTLKLTFGQKHVFIRKCRYASYFKVEFQSHNVVLKYDLRVLQPISIHLI